MNGLLTATVAALLLAGCSSQASEAKKPVPTVSIQTTCDRLFVQGEPRLWTRATTLVAEKSQGATIDAAEVKTVHAELEKIAETSKKVLRPHVQVMAATVGDLDAADNSDYKTAATEVANQCTPYVALD